MKSIVERLNEALNESLDEARVYISDLSDQELAWEFWKQWSGANDGKLGTSGNPKAVKLDNEISRRLGMEAGYAASTIICNAVNDAFNDKFGIDALNMRGYQISKICRDHANDMKKIIEDNWDLITSGRTTGVKKEEVKM